MLAVFLIALSYFFLDARLALYIDGLIKGSDLLTDATSDIPDVLLQIVIIGTILCWTGYFFLTHRGVQNRHTRFLRVCGTILPVAFIAKDIGQYVFGRSDVHAWVAYSRLPRFFWFRMAGGYGCFPSGHMTVFTALGASLSYFYPRNRLIYHSLLILLGVLLVGSDYHFLSDVMAGAFLGALVAFLLGAGKDADKA